MGSSRWALSHSASKKDVAALVKDLGLKQDGKDEYLFVKKISSGSFWREVKIRVRTKEVTTFVYTEEDSVTETYFDYLVECGFLIGKLASGLEKLPVIDVSNAPYEWDEEDDENLEGANG